MKMVGITVNNEQWRDVVGYEGLYSVSNMGRVRRDSGGPGAQMGRILNPALRSGYPNVIFYVKGKKKNHHVHVFVAAAFIGPRPEDCISTTRTASRQITTWKTSST